MTELRPLPAASSGSQGLLNLPLSTVVMALRVRFANEFFSKRDTFKRVQSSGQSLTCSERDRLRNRRIRQPGEALLAKLGGVDAPVHNPCSFYSAFDGQRLKVPSGAVACRTRVQRVFLTVSRDKVVCCEATPPLI